MKKISIKSVWALALLLSFMSGVPAFVFGWGAEGHRIVARTAQRNLSAKARQEILRLLQPGETLESVANWADTIRNSRPETKNWHFVDIPVNANAYDPVRDCPRTPFGDCIINALNESRSILADPGRLESFRNVLANPQESRQARAEALKFLVHFIGDLHQPLHCADDHDRGGNDVHVTFFGVSSNLHKVWDSDIIAKAGLNPTANRVAALSMTGETLTLQEDSFADWALESHRLAVEQAYKIPANKRLGQNYYQSNRLVVDRQLLKAGQRLAAILNEIFP